MITIDKAINQLPKLAKLPRSEIEKFIGYSEKERGVQEAILQGAKEDEDVRDVLARIKELGCWLKEANEELATRPEERRLRFLSEWDLEALPENKIPEVVQGLLKQGGSLLIAAESGTYKSFFALLLALCRGADQALLGRYDVSQGATFIFDAEDIEGEVRRRVRMVRKGMGIPITGSLFVTAKPNIPDIRLDREEDVDLIIESLTGMGSVTLVFDPLIEFHAANENSSQEMAKVTRALNRLQRELGATIILTHHEPKPGLFSRKGKHVSRGSTVLPAWADAMLRLTNTGRNVKAKIVKNRYGPDGHSVVFTVDFDDEEEEVLFEFVREEEAHETQQETALKLVREVFDEEQEWTVKKIHEALKPHRIGINMIREIVKELEADDVIEHRVGAHRKRFYFRKGASVTAQLGL